MPARRHYPPEVKPVSLGELPFVHRPEEAPKLFSERQCARCQGKVPCHWHFPGTAAYSRACVIGYECGAHLAQYLKDQPRWRCHGVLRRILADADFQDETESQGYVVGFIAYIERLFRFAAMEVDVFEDVDQTYAYYREMGLRARTRS